MNDFERPPKGPDSSIHDPTHSLESDEPNTDDISGDLESPQMAPDYRQYVALGGTIDQTEYTKTLQAAEEKLPEKMERWVHNAESMVKFAKLDLKDRKALVVFALLRDPFKPAYVEFHHSLMSDQQLFAEALRMVGDEASVVKFTAAYPNIFETKDLE